MHKILTQYGSNHLGHPVPVRFSPAVLSLFMECVVKEIPLTQGKVAIVDDEDYEELVAHRWCAEKSRYTWYASAYIGMPIAKRIRMHCYIMKAPKGLQCDHHNHDGLDNRRVNLRACTSRENMYNQRARYNCASMYKGVVFDKRWKKWKAQIQQYGQNHCIGGFLDEKDAACAYDTAARERFGEFAYTNFPLEAETKKQGKTDE